MSEHPNRYAITEELGQGAMAVVYRAKDQVLRRDIAIKILREEKCSNEMTRKRLLREAKAVGKLIHPNIVTIYDVGQIGDRPYIAMEVLDGVFLDKFMNQGERFTWHQVIHMGIQLAGALECAHGHGIIHRDIKPANIVWLKDRDTFKLTDFSIAVISDSETQYTQLGEIIGTPQYMSPEQIQGLAIDARSDLFSLGVVLYQMVTGQRPFNGDTVATLAYQIAHGNPDPIRNYTPDAPQHLIKIINTCLKKSPSERYGSATELKQALETLLLPAKKTTRPWNQPIIRWGTLTGSTLLLAGIGVYFSLPGPPPPPLSPPKITQYPPPKSLTPAELTQIKSEISNRLQGLECARIQVEVDEYKKVTLKGHISKEEDMNHVMDVMEALPQKIDNVIYEINTLNWPYCEVVGILEPFKHLNLQDKKGLKISTQTPGKYLSQKDRLILDVTTPQYTAYIYVDYFRSDGKVVHLYPRQADNLQQTPSHTQLQLEQPPTEWIVSPPYGENMVTIVASLNPLVNGIRNNVESAAEYLALLHQQIVINRQQIHAEYFMLSTKAP